MIDALFTLKTQQTKVIRYMNFLHTCTQDNLIPNRFRKNMSPQIMEPNSSNVADEWEKTLIDISTLNEKIEELESLNTLQINTTPLTDTQTACIVKLQHKLEDSRTKKAHTLKKKAQPQAQVNTNSQPHFSASSETQGIDTLPFKSSNNGANVFITLSNWPSHITVHSNYFELGDLLIFSTHSIRVIVAKVHLFTL